MNKMMKIFFSGYFFLPAFFILSLTGCYTTGSLKGIVLGTKEYSLNDYQNAIPRLKEVLSEDPSNQAALKMLAWSYYRLEEYRKAEEVFFEYGRHYPALPEVYKGLAWCYYQTGELTRSANEFRKWLSINPVSREAREGLAACFIELGRDQEAIKELAKYYTLEGIALKFPDWYYPSMLLGQRRVKEMNYGQAHYYFQNALKANPNCLPAKEGVIKILDMGEKRIQLANDYQAKERFQVAARFYSQTSEEFPFWAAPYIGMGECYSQLRQFGDAEASFRKALSLDPDNHRAREGISQVARLRDPNLMAAWENMEKGRYVDASVLFEAVVRGPLFYNIPEDERWNVYLGLGWSYFHAGSIEAARESFQEALRLRENNPESLKGLGFTYYKEEKLTPAEMFMEMAAESLPEDADLTVNLGWTYLKRDKYDKAAQEFESALNLDPGNVSALKGAAWAFYRAGDLKRARVEFASILTVDPEYISSPEFQALVTGNPEWWEFSNALGWRYYKEKDTAKALQAFNASLKQVPNNPGAVQGIGFIRFLQKKYPEAVKSLESVLASGKEAGPIREQDPMDYENSIYSSARSKLAWSYYFSGKYPEAIGGFQRVVKERPDWIDPLYGLALAYHRIKNYAKAEKTYQDILAKKPDYARARAGIEGIKKVRQEEKKKAEAKKKKRKRRKKKEKATKKVKSNES